MKPEARIAQLEKVAELARQLPPSPAFVGSDSDALLRVELALTELDNHSDTRPDSPEQTARARWDSWRHLRPKVSEVAGP
jgi:hypothetical protein